MFTGSRLSAETRALYSDFRKCFNLRSKYILNSRQRLEDNPINYDGHFNPAPNSTSCGSALSDKDLTADSPEPKYKPWKIYPPPPPPHWKNTDDEDLLVV